MFFAGGPPNSLIAYMLDHNNFNELIKFMPQIENFGDHEPRGLNVSQMNRTLYYAKVQGNHDATRKR